MLASFFYQQMKKQEIDYPKFTRYPAAGGCATEDFFKISIAQSGIILSEKEKSPYFLLYSK